MELSIKWIYRILTACGLGLLCHSSMIYDGWWSYYASAVLLLAMLKMLTPRTSKPGPGYTYKKYAIITMMLSISTLFIIPVFFPDLSDPDQALPDFSNTGERIRAIAIIVYTVILLIILTRNDDYVWKLRDQKDDLGNFCESDYDEDDYIPSSEDEQYQKKLYSRKVSFMDFLAVALRRFLKEILEYQRKGGDGSQEESESEEEYELDPERKDHHKRRRRQKSQISISHSKPSDQSVGAGHRRRHKRQEDEKHEIDQKSVDTELQDLNNNNEEDKVKKDDEEGEETDGGGTSISTMYFTDSSDDTSTTATNTTSSPSSVHSAESSETHRSSSSCTSLNTVEDSEDDVSTLSSIDLVSPPSSDNISNEDGRVENHHHHHHNLSGEETD